MLTRRRLIAAAAGGLSIAPGASHAQAAPLRFAVGPYLPTPTDIKKAYQPLADYLARVLEREVILTPVSEWSGVIVGFATNRVDIAWMGPWSFVLARHDSGAEAIAIIKYLGEPTYESLLLARPSLELPNFPHDAKGLRLSLTDVGGTSGWLIPTWYLKSQGIDPKTFFVYRDGATQAANLVGLSNGQLDIVSSYDRFRNELIARGTVREQDSKIIWRYRLPNDPIAVRRDLDPSVKESIRAALLAVSEEDAKSILPRNYTGFAPTDARHFDTIEKAGREVGTLR